MKSLFLIAVEATAAAGSRASYISGLIIAFIILGYLLYALFKPEKF